uniref:Uncharacterized protein n=1 Tax=Cucumis melo TaxID=3656 RepID=A0A9I9ED74_CUCME
MTRSDRGEPYGYVCFRLRHVLDFRSSTKYKRLGLYKRNMDSALSLSKEPAASLSFLSKIIRIASALLYSISFPLLTNCGPHLLVPALLAFLYSPTCPLLIDFMAIPLNPTRVPADIIKACPGFALQKLSNNDICHIIIKGSTTTNNSLIQKKTKVSIQEKKSFKLGCYCGIWKLGLVEMKEAAGVGPGWHKMLQHDWN